MVWSAHYYAMAAMLSSQTSGASTFCPDRETSQKQLRWDKADLPIFYNRSASSLPIAHLLPILDKLLSVFEKPDYVTNVSLVLYARRVAVQSYFSRYIVKLFINSGTAKI